jgi:hypothetical protein
MEFEGNLTSVGILSNRTFRTVIVRDGEPRQCPDIGMAAADEIGREELSFAFEDLDVAKHGETLADRRLLGFAEGVRQLRGTSVNQVPDVEHVLVTAGTGVPTSGLILGRRALGLCRRIRSTFRWG